MMCKQTQMGLFLVGTMLLCVQAADPSDTDTLKHFGPFKTRNPKGWGWLRTKKVRWLKLDTEAMILTTHTDFECKKPKDGTNRYDANNITIEDIREQPTKNRHKAYLNANDQEGGPSKFMYTIPCGVLVGASKLKTNGEDLQKLSVALEAAKEAKQKETAAERIRKTLGGNPNNIIGFGSWGSKPHGNDHAAPDEKKSESDETVHGIQQKSLLHIDNDRAGIAYDIANCIRATANNDDLPALSSKDKWLCLDHTMYTGRKVPCYLSVGYFSGEKHKIDMETVSKRVKDLHDHIRCYNWNLYQALKGNVDYKIPKGLNISKSNLKILFEWDDKNIPLPSWISCKWRKRLVRVRNSMPEKRLWKGEILKVVEEHGLELLVKYHGKLSTYVLRKDDVEVVELEGPKKDGQCHNPRDYLEVYKAALEKSFKEYTGHSLFH